jgi:CRP-like cAMP-binding protein
VVICKLTVHLSIDERRFTTRLSALSRKVCCRSKMEERLARWLLMADDRVDGDELPLTHEFLGLMLGTYRPGVTKAVQALEEEGLISARRGSIAILNRKSLEKRSNGTYVPADA